MLLMHSQRSIPQTVLGPKVHWRLLNISSEVGSPCELSLACDVLAATTISEYLLRFYLSLGMAAQEGKVGAGEQIIARRRNRRLVPEGVPLNSRLSGALSGNLDASIGAQIVWCPSRVPTQAMSRTGVGLHGETVVLGG